METTVPLLTGRAAALADVEADWLIVPVFEGESLSAPVSALDARLGRALDRLCQSGDLTGKANELVPLLRPSGIASERVLCVGVGKRSALDRATLNDAAAAAARSATGKPTRRLAFALPDGLPAGEAALAGGVGLVQGCVGPGLRKSSPTRYSPQELWLVAPTDADGPELQAAVRRAASEAQSVALARELINLPPCELYPESFAERARQLAAETGFECDVLDEARLKQERMGALLGIAHGSDRPPRVVVLRYRGGKSDRTLGLVGKGVTFDSGGLSLKTVENMADMKTDMAGSAAVLGAMQVAAELAPPFPVHGYLGAAENMPSGTAYRPGDVLVSRLGKTVEVTNTDAEGRLVLGDVLAYAVEQKPSAVVDLATLTGACVVALGNWVGGLFSNDDALAGELLEAAGRAGEAFWRLPLVDLQKETLRSEVADMKNSGERWGGAITAAVFLREFVGDTPWAHLDIAGPSQAPRERGYLGKGATGIGVRTLAEFLVRRSVSR